MSKILKNREPERGSAGVKALCVLAALALVGHAGYNYIPVAYGAESVKTDMNTAIMQGMALPGKVNVIDNVKTRIQRTFVINDVPADAILEVKQSGTGLTARVAYVKQVDILPFGIYKYSYTFDHTATPTGFLMKQY